MPDDDKPMSVEELVDALEDEMRAITGSDDWVDWVGGPEKVKAYAKTMEELSLLDAAVRTGYLN